MIFKFTIQGRLPGLNEIINACRRNRFMGAKQKEKATAHCGLQILALNVPKFTRPVLIRLHFVEPNRRRDQDNIQSGSKFILDALVRTGRLVNDSQKWVRVRPEVSDVVDGQNPRVEVEIEEIL